MPVLTTIEATQVAALPDGTTTLLMVAAIGGPGAALEWLTPHMETCHATT